MVTYLKDTDALEIYSGSAWVGYGSGDITGVTAGTGISGGGTSGTVTVTNSMATEITAAGDIIVGTGSGTFDNLPIGTTAQVLTADTTVSPYKVKWATPTSGMTNPMTTTGDTIYASSGSTPARLGIGTTGQVLTVASGIPSWATPASGSSFVGCAIYKATTAQTLSNDTDTDITFNAEDYDTNAFHDNTTNNQRITIPSGKAGKYILQTIIIFAANGTGVRDVAFLKNGATILGSMLAPALSSFSQRVEHIWIGELAVGDYITVKANQNSGGNLNVAAEQNYTRFTATYLGA
jgi:hypothetical protein